MSYYGTQEIERLAAKRSFAYVPAYEIEREVRHLRAEATAAFVKAAAAKLKTYFAAPKAAAPAAPTGYVLSAKEREYLERGEKIADVVVAFRKLVSAPKSEQMDLPLESYYLSLRDQAQLERGEKIADALIAVGRAIKKVAAWLYAPIKLWRAEARTRDELMLLDDRTLADIGLTRGDIPRVAAGMWVPENRLAHVRHAVTPVSVSNTNKPPLAA